MISHSNNISTVVSPLSFFIYGNIDHNSTFSELASHILSYIYLAVLSMNTNKIYMAIIITNTILTKIEKERVMFKQKLSTN